MAKDIAAQTVAIIGGSGLYKLEGLTVLSEEEVRTPFGNPSSPILRGSMNGLPCLFLARHGRGHTLLPSEVNARANIYALKSLGATWCIGVSAVGSLRADLPPGTLVVPDQLIDRTTQRHNTFFGEGLVAHVAFADPYCPTLRQVLARVAMATAKSAGFGVATTGTYVCMEGPAFSTRAESQLHRAWGASLIGMTALPEAKLAREAELAYATLALVTDFDCWKEDEEHVDSAMVIKTMQTNAKHAQTIVAETIRQLAHETPSTLASSALSSAIFTDLKLVSQDRLHQLRPILHRLLMERQTSTTPR